jgi:hypothetical protein
MKKAVSAHGFLTRNFVKNIFGIPKAHRKQDPARLFLYLKKLKIDGSTQFYQSRKFKKI